MLVNCTGCRTPLQFPAEAKSIRCALCLAITKIADSRALPQPAPDHPPSPSPSFHTPSTSFNLSSPSSHTPSPHGRKRAVICGISYRHSRHELKGCINDAKCMRYLLINRFKFPKASILMLTGLGSISGRTIALGQVCGKEHKVEKLFHLVVVMMIKRQLKPRLYQRSLQQVS